MQQAQDDTTSEAGKKKAEEFNQILAAAKKMHEAEVVRAAERQRRREQREAAANDKRKKIEAETIRIRKMTDLRSSGSSLELARLFSDLQAVSIENNLGLKCPELVIVGMQSDGKSSLVEALLGFQFNIVSSNIGTRRPLIINMINSRAHSEPLCRFRKEENSSNSDSNLDDFELVPTAVANLSAEIIRRTNLVAGAEKNRVSAKPIFLRVEYANCANLTIYDTPGFRIGGDSKLREEIHEMVIELIRPPERIIICLEQSTVEWANSTSRSIIQIADSQFKRTLFLHTKFDNRCKELRSVDEAEKYLRSEELPIGIRNFFISLPIERNLPPREFQEAIRNCYLNDFAHLIRIGVDEKELLSKIGFPQMEMFLERQMAIKYQNAFFPTLESLEKSVIDLNHKFQIVTQNLEEKNPIVIRNRAMSYVASVAQIIERILVGSAIGDPEQFGMTLKQERELLSESGVLNWNEFDLNYPIENSNRKLYGGPQFNRLVNEFTWIAHSVELPPTSIDEVASAIGTSSNHNLPNYQSAASDLVQLKSKRALFPLLNLTLQRARKIIDRMFDVAIAVVARDDFESSSVGSNHAFCNSFRGVFAEFVDGIFANCSAKMTDDVKSFTEVLDCWTPAIQIQIQSENNSVSEMLEKSVSLFDANQNAEATDLLKRALALSKSNANPPSANNSNVSHLNLNLNSKDDTRNRVLQIMNRRDAWADFFPSASGRQTDDASYKAFIFLCRNLFDSVRFKFVSAIRNHLSALILRPLFAEMRDAVVFKFGAKIQNDDFAEIFAAGSKTVEAEKNALSRKLVVATKLRDSFRATVAKFNTPPTAAVVEE